MQVHSLVAETDGENAFINSIIQLYWFWNRVKDCVQKIKGTQSWGEPKKYKEFALQGDFFSKIELVIEMIQNQI